MLSRSELRTNTNQNPNPIPLHFILHHIHHTHSAKLLPTAVKTKVNGKVRNRTGHEVSVDVQIYSFKFRQMRKCSQHHHPALYHWERESVPIV